MIKHFRFLILFCLCAFESCDKGFHDYIDVEGHNYAQSLSKGSGSVYDERTGFYLVPCKDVYEIGNVQKEYEKLTGSTARLQPTHMALKILPPDEVTAHKLLTDTTMWVSSIPFGWRPIAQKSTPSPSFDKRMLEFEIKEPQTDEVADEGVPPIVQPIYVRWPVWRSIPANISYEHLYDIYTPSNNTDVDSLLFMALSPGITQRTQRPDGGHSPIWHLQIKAYDNVLNSYKEMKYVHVTFRDYTTYYTRTLCTDTFGMVEVPLDAPMSCIALLNLYTDKFKVTSENNSDYVSFLLYGISYMAEMPYSSHMGIPTTTINMAYAFKLHVFQSAQYYYRGSNDLLNNISKFELDNPLRIAAYYDSTRITHNGDKGVGWFLGNANPPYIEIANFSSYSSWIFGTVLHELGHASHRSEMGWKYSYTEPRIKESFATFMGWYNVKQYYSSVLLTDEDVHGACHQGRQDWEGNSNDYYTPIYIDLADDYNQYLEINSSYVNDNISNIPVSNILNFAIGPMTWTRSKQLMQGQIGSLYSSSDFNNLISLY